VVHNAAARLLAEGCTPHLISLHWLPVCYRIDFKVPLMVYKHPKGLAPSYLTDLSPCWTLFEEVSELLKPRTVSESIDTIHT